MRYEKASLALLTVTATLIGLPVRGEVVHRQFGDDNLMVVVSDDVWQPEGFVNGTTVPAAYVAAPEIVLDGKDQEPAWNWAVETTVPLVYGSVTEASLKAIYTDEHVYIRVRWPDPTEDREHHPWVWNAEQERYVSGPQVEDSLLLSFEAGCEWRPSMLAGYVYDFDAWHWLAARSDPVGQAWDKYGSTYDRNRPGYQHEEYPSRVAEKTWNLKFNDHEGQMLHEGWDELGRSYNLRIALSSIFVRTEVDGLRVLDASEQLPPPDELPADVAAVFPQFKAVELTGDAGEIQAKGHWEDGYWTVEFKRILETPSRQATDTLFNRLTQFSVNVFDHAERFDQASESARLFLRFMPKEQLLVKD